MKPPVTKCSRSARRRLKRSSSSVELHGPSSVSLSISVISRTRVIPVPGAEGRSRKSRPSLTLALISNSIDI